MLKYENNPENSQRYFKINTPKSLIKSIRNLESKLVSF